MYSTLQIGNKSTSSGHHRTLTRKYIDYKLDNSDTDSFNKTLREKSSFGDWVASSGRKDTSSRKTPMKNPQSPTKKDEIITNEPEKRLNNDYFSNSTTNSMPKMEKFDFGPSPYLTDKYQKLPRVTTTSQTNLASFHSAKLESSSATLKLGQLDFDEVRRSRNEFTNIIERVRGDRASPAVFSKLTGFIDKRRRSKSNKKKLRRDADGNMIMIRSIATTSTALGKSALELGECSPISRVYNPKFDRGSLEEIGPDMIREDEGSISFKPIGSRESLEYLNPETPKLMTRTRIKISRESTKSIVDNKLLNMVKGRYQDKLQEKIALKPKVWPVK